MKKKNHMHCGKLCPVTFGLALSIMMSVALFVFGLIAAHTPYWTDAVALIGKFYLGYSASLEGAFIGALWAFIDMFCAGFAFAWVYNWLTGLRHDC